MTDKTKFTYKYRCPEKDKYTNDMEIAKKVMNEIIPSFVKSKDWIEEYNNDLSSYKLYNNDISSEDFERVCNPLGIDIGQYDEEVLPYNKTYIKIDVLLGEEYKRGTTFMLALLNSKALDEKDQELRNLYKAYVEEVCQKHENIMQMQQQGASQSQLQQALQQEIQSRTPEDIEKTSYLSEKEILGNHILNYGMYKEDVRAKKNDGMKHALISDKEFIYSGVDKGEPTIKLINPLNMFYQKDPDTRYVQDGDYAGHIAVMSVEKVLETYGHLLEKDDLDKIQKRIPGFAGPQYTGQLEFNLDATLTNRELASIANLSYLGKNIGNYTDDINANRKLMHDTYSIVTNLEWKWLREITFLTIYSESKNEPDDVQVIDGDFEIPEEAVSVKFINNFGEKSEKYEWQDESGQQMCLEKMWIPRVWQGTRIDNDIFPILREKPFQPFSIESPFNVKLGYHGCVFNSTNAKPISLMGRMKPFQFLFFVVLHQVKELVPKHIGPIQNFDTSMIDPNLAGNDSDDPYQDALGKTFYYRQKGLNIYNSMSNNIGGQSTQVNISRPQPGSVQNMSVAGDLHNLLELLGWLDTQIGLAAGVSQQREAQFSSNTNVTDNQQAITQSSHITEHYFRKHNDLWREVMESYIAYAKLAWRGKKIRRQYLMPDLSVNTLDIDENTDLENSDYGLFVTDSGKEFEYIEKMAKMAELFVQSGVSAETVSYILKARAQGTSPEEIHRMITKIQIDSEQRAQAAEKSKQDADTMLQKREIESREDEQSHQVELQQMKNETALAVAEITATKSAGDSSIGIDPVELAKIEMQDRHHSEELEIQSEKSQVENRKLDVKEKEININKNLKNKEIDTKAETEKMKARTKTTTKPK